MPTLTTLNIASTAKHFTVLGTYVGFVAGLIYSLGGLIVDATNGPLNEGTALAFLALIGMPVIYGIGGLVLGILGAWLFNLTSKQTGGIRYEHKK